MKEVKINLEMKVDDDGNVSINKFELQGSHAELAIGLHCMAFSAFVEELDMNAQLHMKGAFQLAMVRAFMQGTKDLSDGLLEEKTIDMLENMLLKVTESNMYLLGKAAKGGGKFEEKLNIKKTDETDEKESGRSFEDFS